MYSQIFTPYNLYLCSTQIERRNIGLSKEEFIHKIDECINNSITDDTYQFLFKTSSNLYLNGYSKKDFKYICQNLVLRKLYNNIKRIYNVEQANRNQIIKQIISLLKEKVTYWIVRLDVHHFYESINRDKLLERFIKDGRLNIQSINLLKKIFFNLAISSTTGLPCGINISSVMSELYMKYFDIDVQRIDGVFYYARFVDDIIIFCSSEKSQADVWQSVSKELAKLNLEINKTKSYKWNNNNSPKGLTYLGYTFSSKDKKNISVSIAEKKVNKIKTRITKSFVRFAKDSNYELLKNRIKFLTGNFTLYNYTTLLPIKIGIYFNYKEINQKGELAELDRYYQSILHCKTGELGNKLNQQMNANQRKDLSKYSFSFGFEKHVNHHFDSKIISEITECWQ